MITIKSKDYDLSSLFRVDLLREILLSLAEYQNDINSEIASLKNYNKIQDIRLSRLEEKNEIKFDPTEFKINISNYESTPIYQGISDNKNKEEKIKCRNCELITYDGAIFGTLFLLENCILLDNTTDVKT